MQTQSSPTETPVQSIEISDNDPAQLLTRCVRGIGWLFAAQVVLIAFAMKGEDPSPVQATVWAGVAALCVLGAICMFARLPGGQAIGLAICGATVGINFTALVIDSLAGVAAFAPVPGPMGTLLIPAFAAIILNQAADQFGSAAPSGAADQTFRSTPTAPVADGHDSNHSQAA